MKKIFLTIVFPCLLYGQTGYIMNDNSGSQVFEHTQSAKSWYTDGFWWVTAHDSSASWSIHRRSGSIPSAGTEGGWVNIRTYLDTRASSLVDIYWSESDQVLYEIGMHSSTPQYHEFDYNSSTNVYTKNATVGDLDVSGAAQLTSAADGNLNITVMRDSADVTWLLFAHSTGLIAGYSTTTAHTDFDTFRVDTRVTGTSSSRPSAIIYQENGVETLAVFYGETTNGTWQCATHRSADSPTTWTKTQVADVANVDDHNNMKTEGGALYAITKDGGDDLFIYNKQPGGAWSSGTNVVNNVTRPQIMIDETNDSLYVFYQSSISNNTIVFKTAKLAASMTFSAQRVFIENATESQVFSNFQGAKQNATATTDLYGFAAMVTAPANETWYNWIDIIAPSVPQTPQTKPRTKPLWWGMMKDILLVMQ